MRQGIGTHGSLELAGQLSSAQIHHTDVVFGGDPPRHLVTQQPLKAIHQPHAPDKASLREQRHHKIELHLAISRPVVSAVGGATKAAGAPQRAVGLIAQRWFLHQREVALVPKSVAIGTDALHRQELRVLSQEKAGVGDELRAGQRFVGKRIGHVGAPLLVTFHMQPDRLFQPQHFLDEVVALFIHPVAVDEIDESAKRDQKGREDHGGGQPQ